MIGERVSYRTSGQGHLQCNMGMPDAYALGDCTCEPPLGLRCLRIL